MMGWLALARLVGIAVADVYRDTLRLPPCKGNVAGYVDGAFYGKPAQGRTFGYPCGDPWWERSSTDAGRRAEAAEWLTKLLADRGRQITIQVRLAWDRDWKHQSNGPLWSDVVALARELGFLVKDPVWNLPLEHPIIEERNAECC